MISFLTTQLGKLLGGGASYLILGLGAAILLQHWQIANLQKAQAELETERDQAIKQVQEKDTIISSQNRQYQRQVQTRKDETSAEDIIKSVPDSEECIRSATINGALGWLREHESAAAETHHDNTNVRMPREADPSE